MKKGKILLSILLCIISLTCVVSVSAVIPVDPPTPGEVEMLFKICDKRGENCIVITSETINTNQKYDLFELKNKEIYLDNSEITFEIFSTYLPGYVVHIDGTNKITYLSNNNVVGEYVPFSVEGDGTLEVETTKFIKKNELGETYYKCWQLNKKICEVGRASTKNNTNTSIDTNEVKLLRKTAAKLAVEITDTTCLTEVTVNANNNTVTFSTPKYGYTLSDIKQKFGANADAFYKAEVGSTITMQEYNAFPPTMLKSYAGANDNVLTSDGRMQFIDTLVENGNNVPDCGTSYMLAEEVVFEEATIPASWGLEYIQTDLRRSYSDTGSYLIGFPEEQAKEMITTTQKENITFISKEKFDPSYYLRVDDITEKITDVQSLSVQAKTDKTLVELYDINMYDQNDNIVKMENGTYTIKVELDDLLKKYEGYQVIYISEDNKVELIDATVEGNYIIFNTTHLSKYGIVGTEIRKTGNIITNPQTADAVVTYGIIFGALVVAVVMVLFRIKKLKKEN